MRRLAPVHRFLLLALWPSQTLCPSGRWSKGSALRLAILTTLTVLTLGATNAPADTLSIAVSPSSAIGHEPVQLTVSGSASAGAWLTLLALEQGTCQPKPVWGEFSLKLRTEEVTSLPYTTSLVAPFSRGLYTLCAYLQKEAAESAEVLATAQTSLTVTEDPIEVEEAARTKAAEERYAREMYEKEAPAREAAAKAKAKAEAEAKEQQAIRHESEQEEAEWTAAEKRANKMPVTRLSARTIARPGESSQSPGGTELVVTATPFAHVTVKLTRYGHRTEHFTVEGSAPTALSGSADVHIEWTCSRPGGAYRYVVTARSDVGPTLTRRGHFSPVSVARCHMLKRREREARERNARRYAEEVRQRVHAENERLKRWEGNCRALGGTPVTLHTSEGDVRACRKPGGGTLPVPY
jgi:hypothetical protein